MIKLKEIVNRKLVVFDFDDTLMKTDSKVYITHKNGTEEKLNADQWNRYIKKPGDKFNFDEFFTVDYLINPREIPKQMGLLKDNIKWGNEVWILTNRENVSPIKRYFDAKGLNVGVKGTGTPNPEGKRKWFEEKIGDGYNDIEFHDDSEKNIKLIGTLIKKYPNIKLKLNLVK